MGAFGGLGKDLKELTVAGVIALVLIALVIGFKDSGKVDNSQADVVKAAIVTILAFFGVMGLIVVGVRLLKSLKKID